MYLQLVVTFQAARKRKLLVMLTAYDKRAGATLKSSTEDLKCVPNIKLIFVNFSLIHEKVKTEVWITVSFMFWALAAAWHLVIDFGKEKDNLTGWIIQILVAFTFATGFGWHTHKLAALKQMEQRGNDNNAFKEFGAV